jgi:2-amino-4-hydroxy-6-hydroxymethyldihydropteridine diphosphokinase
LKIQTANELFWRIPLGSHDRIDTAEVMKISQRNATLDDLEWLELFYESMMRPYVELTHEWDSTKFREDFDPQIIKVIQADGIDIGMMKVEEREDCIYLGDLQIDRAYQNKGIGTNLIKTVIRSASIVNKPVRLRVLKGNPAKGLYIRLGFQFIQALDNAYILERKSAFGTLSKCAIALGSNLGDSLSILNQTIDRINTSPQIELIAVSSWYITTPIGPPQPDYLNGCAIVWTSLAPLEFLNTLHAIESQFGRVREEVWGARTLDLDLLLYGDEIIDTPDLQVPHPRMTERGFVLVPLAEIAPDAIDPKSGDSILVLRNKLKCSGIELSVARAENAAKNNQQ